VDTSGLRAPEEPRPVDAEVLRRLNVALREEGWALEGEPPTPTPAYGRTVREVLANQVLAKVAEAHSVRLPAGYDVWLARQAATVVKEVAGKRYDVVGDLQELAPTTTLASGNDRPPERHSDRVVLPAALETLSGMSSQLLTMSEELDLVRARLAEAEEERDRLRVQVDRLAKPMQAGRKVIRAVRGDRR
jgi:hypothetical protein